MFSILKIVHPVWYFNLAPSNDPGYFPGPGELNGQTIDFTFDNTLSENARDAERAYLALRSGIISSKMENGFSWWGKSQFSAEDEYRFARKYFHPSRVFTALIWRLLTFHNPFREINAFIKSANVNRKAINYSNHNHDAFQAFQSALLKNAPLVTVVIPTLNRYDHLENVLHDFEKQDYKNFEIIIIDQSDAFNPDFYKKFNLKLRVIHQLEKALWMARNQAIRESKSEFIALSEDDVRIPVDWISNHMKCIDYFNSDISAGVFFPSGSGIPPEKKIFRWAEQFATGNACLKKDVFRSIGLFDRQFEKQRMGDGEFGLRAYLAGFKSVSNPFSWCEDVKATSGGLRHSGAWDAFRPKSIWSPRPLPAVLYFYRKYFGRKAALLTLIYNIPPSVVPYRYKRNKPLLVGGSLLALVISPLIFIQVMRSWNIASSMLKNPRIEFLND